MADDIRLAGVRFVAEDYSSFRKTLRSANSDIKEFNDNLSKVSNRTGNLGTKLSGAGKNVTGLGTSFSRSRRDMVAWLGDLSLIRFGIEALVRDIIGLGEIVVGIPASYESAFAGIAKTVDGLAVVSDEGFFQLTEGGEALKQELKDLSENVLPATFEELSKYAELGGQLDILPEDGTIEQNIEALTNFTETIAGLNESTDIVGEEAAIKLSQIVNLYKDQIGDITTVFSDLGNVVAGLGNDTSTTESQILQLARRVANAGAIINLQVDEVFGLSAAISSTGITAEAGGTSISNGLLLLNGALKGSSEVIQDNTEDITAYEEKLLSLNAKLVRLEAQTGASGQSMIELRDEFLEGGGAIENFGRVLGDARREQLFKTQKAINELSGELVTLREENGKSIAITSDTIKLFAQTAGLTVDEFKKLADEDVSEALTLFVEGLGKIDAEGGDAVKILNQIGINSEQAERTFLSLGKAGSTLRDAFALSNKEFTNGSALIDEVANRYSTLESHAAMFNNTVRNTIDDIFSGLIPSFVRFLDVAGQVVDIIGKRLPKSFELLQAALKPLENINIDIDVDPVKLTTEGFDELDEFLKNLNVQPFVNFVNKALEIKDVTFGGVSESLTDLRTSIQELMQTDTIQNFLMALDRLKESSGVQIDLATIFVNVATFPIDTLTSTVDLLTKIIELIEAYKAQDTKGVDEALKGIETAIKERILRPLELIDETLPELKITEKVKAILDSINFEKIDTKSIETATQKIADFAETLQPLITEILPGLTENISELVQKNIDFEDLRKGITEFLQDLGTISYSTIESGVGILSGLNIVLKGINENSTALKNSGALEIGEAIAKGIGTPLETMFASQDISTEYVKPITELFEAIIKLNEALSSVDNLQVEVDDDSLIGDKFLANILPAGIEQLTNVVESITALTNLLNSSDTASAGENAKTFAQSLAELFVVSDQFNQLSESIEDADSFGAKVQAVLNTLSNLEGAEPLTPGELNIFPTSEEVERWFDENFTPFKIELKSLVNLPTKEEVTEAMTALAIDLSQGLLDAVATTQNLQSQALSIGDLIVPPSTQEWLEWAKDLASNVADAIQMTLNEITNPANISITKIIEITGVDEFVEELKSILSEIEIFGVTPFQSLAAPDIEDPDFSEPIAKFGEAPKLMADSYEQGMDDADKSFVERTKDTGSKIKQAILDALGFQSPSQFFINVGKDIISSIAIGLEDLTPINEAFTTALRDEVIPTSLEWDETNIQISDTILSTLIPSIESTITIIEHLMTTIESADGTTRDWANTFTTVLVPALRSTQDQLKMIKDKSEDVIEVVDKLTESYLALASAIIAANNAGTVNAPTIPAPGQQTPSGAAPFALGGSFIVPTSIPEMLKGSTGGMNIEVHPGEFVQVLPKSTTKAIERLPTNVLRPISTHSEGPISGQNIQNMVDNSILNNSQELHLHIKEAPTANVRDSFELMKILSGK